MKRILMVASGLAVVAMTADSTPALAGDIYSVIADCETVKVRSKGDSYTYTVPPSPGFAGFTGQVWYKHNLFKTTCTHCGTTTVTYSTKRPKNQSYPVKASMASLSVAPSGKSKSAGAASTSSGVNSQQK